MLTPYESLSSESKVWIYPSSRKFYKEEIQGLEEKITKFLTNWKQEDENFSCAFELRYNRFIIIGANAQDAMISMQEMDSLVGFILGLQNDYDVELLDRMNACFKQGEFVQYKELKDFKKLLKNKSVSEKTIVFDNLIQTKEELEEFWEVPITDSWYNRFL
jgi:hypothetical protein